MVNVSSPPELSIPAPLADKLVQKIDLKDAFRIMETGPALSEQIGAAITKIAARMSKDAQEAGVINQEFSLATENMARAGDTLYCAYLLKKGDQDGPNKETRISLILLEGVSDQKLLEAYGLLEERDRIRREARQWRRTVDTKEIEAERLLGLGKRYYSDDERKVTEIVEKIEEEEESKGPAICITIGSVFIKQSGHNRLLQSINDTSDNPARMQKEEWTLFKVVKGGKIEYRLRKRPFLLLSPEDVERAAPVSSGKLILLERMLNEATFQNAEYKPPQLDGVNQLAMLTRYSR